MKPLHLQDSEDCPPVAKGALQRYIEEGLPLGDALGGMVENDMRRFMGHADAENLNACAAIFKYIYNRMPSGCWGNPDIVEDWQEMGGQNGSKNYEKWNGHNSAGYPFAWRAFALIELITSTKEHRFKISRKKLTKCPLTLPEDVYNFIIKNSEVTNSGAEPDVSFTTDMEDYTTPLGDDDDWKGVLEDLGEAMLKE